MSKVIARDCRDYNLEKVGAVLDEILDTFCPRVEGRSVFVKPNMVGGFPPEKGVTTHPVFIRALVSTLRRRGAREISVGDNPGMGGYAKSRRIARKTGILEAAGEAFRNISAGGEMVDAGGTRMHVSREILEADVLINLPRFKTHSLTGYTGAIKNMFGIIIGSGKVNTHRNFPNPLDFSSIMADICAVRPPDLSILDGITVMEGNGPSSGPLRKVGKILASPDPVALDYTALGMIGLPHEKVPMVDRAKKLGLGDYENVELDGEADPIPRFKLPVTMKLPGGIIEHVVNGIGCYFISRRIPKLIKKKCTGCKDCVQQCPTGALVMEGKHPRLNKKTCISCFCCMELCAESAYKLKIKWFN